MRTCVWKGRCGCRGWNGTGVEHNLLAVSHVDRPQLGILLQPSGQVCLIRLIPGQIIRASKVHQRLMWTTKKYSANIFGIGQIHLAESCRYMSTLGVERLSELAIPLNARGANGQRIRR